MRAITTTALALSGMVDGILATTDTENTIFCNDFIFQYKTLCQLCLKETFMSLLFKLKVYFRQFSAFFKIGKTSFDVPPAKARKHKKIKKYFMFCEL